jgi:hypothetical protein
MSDAMNQGGWLSRWISDDPTVVYWGVDWVESRRSLDSPSSSPLRLVNSAPVSDLVIALIGVLDPSRIAGCLLSRWSHSSVNARYQPLIVPEGEIAHPLDLFCHLL